MHDRSREGARQVLDRPHSLVFVASCDDAGDPQRIVLLQTTNESVLFDAAVDPAAQTGPTSFDAVLAELHGVITSSGVVWSERRGIVEVQGIDLVEWDHPTGQRAALRLLNRDGALATDRQARDYPWLQLGWKSASWIFKEWYAEPTSQAELDLGRATAPEEGRIARWVGEKADEFLKRHTDYYPELYEPRHQQLPGVSGDPVADAHQVVQVLRDVATGTAPVSPLAPFA